MVDGQTILYVPTPGEGFWNHCHLGGTNIWASGGRNAPFDQPVSTLVVDSITSRQRMNHKGQNTHILLESFLYKSFSGKG